MSVVTEKTSLDAMMRNEKTGLINQLTRALQAYFKASETLYRFRDFSRPVRHCTVAHLQSLD
jgi:hypothetical protein